MSLQSCMATLQRMREEHRDNPDHEVQRILTGYALDLGQQYVAEILHASFMACVAIENARHGRSMY